MQSYRLRPKVIKLIDELADKHRESKANIIEQSIEEKAKRESNNNEGER